VHKVARPLALIAAAVFAVSWIVGVSRWHWATRVPDAAHTYGIRFKGGDELFFRPHLGWFVDNAIWICLALFVAAALMDKFSTSGAAR